MQDQRKTKAQLIAELAALQRRVAELESRPVPAPDQAAPPADPPANEMPHGESYFRTLVEALSEAVTLTDLSGRIIFANEQSARLHGFAAPRDMVGASVFDLIAATRQAAAADVVRQAVTDHRADGAEIQAELLRQDGTVFWGELIVTAIHDAQHRPVGVLGLTRDITAQRQMQQALADANAVLDAAINQSPVPMALLSAPDGVIQIVNPAMRDALGRSEEINDVGRPLADIERSWTILDAAGNPLPLEQLPIFTAIRGQASSTMRYSSAAGTARYARPCSTPCPSSTRTASKLRPLRSPSTSLLANTWKRRCAIASNAIAP